MTRTEAIRTAKRLSELITTESVMVVRRSPDQVWIWEGEDILFDVCYSRNLQKAEVIPIETYEAGKLFASWVPNRREDYIRRALRKSA